MATRVDWLRASVGVLTGAVYVFLALPTVVVVVSSFSAADYLVFPPPALSIRWYAALAGSSEWVSAFQVSALVAGVVTPVCVALGTPAAYAIVRLKFPGRDPINALILSPLMIPQVLLGITILYYFVQLRLINTLAGLVAAHTLVALPYVVRAIAVSVYHVDEHLERAAATLGATFWRTFVDITLPLVRTGMLAGAIFAAITSLGELALTLFVAGANTTTLPLRIFNYLETGFNPTITAVAAIFIFMSVALLLALDRIVGVTKVF